MIFMLVSTIMLFLLWVVGFAYYYNLWFGIVISLVYLMVFTNIVFLKKRPYIYNGKL